MVLVSSPALIAAISDKLIDFFHNSDEEVQILLVKLLEESHDYSALPHLVEVSERLGLESAKEIVRNLITQSFGEAGK